MSRRLALVALLAAALVSGCGNEGITRGGTVLSNTLTVYSLLPAPASGAAADAVDGEKLALAQAGGRAGRFTINFASLDEGAAGQRGAVADADAARTVIGDTQVIAVIDGLDTAGTRTSAPLFNEAGILQVALGAGYPGLTRRGLPGEPERYQPAAQPTLMRMVGDDDQQAAAIVAAVADPRPRPVLAASNEAPVGLSGKRIAIEQEPGDEADALAGAVRRQAERSGARLVADPARADALVYAGTDVANAAGVADGWAREAPGARILLPDALVRAGVVARLSPAARSRAVLVSSAPAAGSARDRAFQADFRRRLGRSPGPYAAVGYEAMRSVLGALGRAGNRANVRQAVIDAYLSAPERQSLLGPLKVDRSGDRVAPTFTISRP
jgi:ABC-type branched-subunit amino acid transport system substrate-binding protein